LLLAINFFKPAYGNENLICDEIARKVELEYNLPTNILASIAIVEAGRRQHDGSIKPWPWSLNHAGKSLFFDKKTDALTYLRNNITAKFRNIDVGCMQINVRWHQKQFKSFSAMIDPRKNIEYAAKFLIHLKEVHGSWEYAIKHYHSATPKLHKKYYAKVEKAWSKKSGANLGIQNASLFNEESISYLINADTQHNVVGSNAKKDLEESKKGMLKFLRPELKDQDNQIYLNAELIDNGGMYDKEELKQYIKYKSAYLRDNIDMILLFREEFLKN
tara:strand:+ start:561 stop:1382 length:822 start_codon:yes stop_codon:yes gene_type:complete